MKNCIIIALATILLSSCAQQNLTTMTRSAQYPQLYEENPVSIVIMPPVNQTNFVEAKEYFYTTMYLPLCEKGYYVYSPYLTMEMFQSESAYDSEMFLESDLSTFRNVLGVDAVMFTVIKSWKRNNAGGSLTAGVEYILRSATTGETLYQREGLVAVDMSVRSNGGGLLGALVDLAATAISTAATDKVVAGRKCTTFVLSDMPAGKYDPNHGKDGDVAAGKSYVKATIR